MPHPIAVDPSQTSRRFALCLSAPTIAFAAALVASTVGCTALLPGRSEEAEKEARLRELMTVPDAPELIRQAAIPHGMRPVQVDGVAMVDRLRGTGGPADPSAFRDQLLEELKRDDTRDPNQLLEQDDTALVRVRAVVPPGAQRRDRLDLRVLSPNKSRASDLHGGRIAKARMRHQQVIKGAVRQSAVMVIGQGHVLTRGDYEPSQEETAGLEGILLSGGVVQVDRKLGLVLRPEFEHAKLASDLASAINRRFFFFDGTTRRGIARAIEDDFIEVDLHPRYRENVYRLMEVVRAIGVKPESTESQKRLTELSERLEDPATAADAALQLEAIGESAIPILLQGIESSNPELRFYAAEALAYLDRTEAIVPLEKAAREVPAFRHDALLAIQELQRQASVDALRRLMNEPSLETRYGSFCAIRRREDSRSHLIGHDMGPAKVYRVASDAAPAVVLSLREEAEVVLFGETQEMRFTGVLMGSGGLMLRPAPEQPGKVKIVRFAPGKEDQRITVSANVADVITGVGAVGGGYGDVVTVLRTAKEKGYLVDQLAIDPLPRPLRTYHRDQEFDDESDESDEEESPESEDSGSGDE